MDLQLEFSLKLPFYQEKRLLSDNSRYFSEGRGELGDFPSKKKKQLSYN